MKVKTYTFDDIRKGMDVIKEQFGPDTIIMDIKQNNLNGDGWTKKACEISIAVDNEPIATLETDLGEYIVQQAGEKPYHIVTPAMHKSKEEVAELFTQKFGLPAGSSPQERAPAVMESQPSMVS